MWHYSLIPLILACDKTPSVCRLTPRPPLPLQVYLEAHKQAQQKQQQSLKMLSDEVSQIQEVSTAQRLPALRYVTISWVM